MRTLEIGAEAATGVFVVKYNSRNHFSIQFWDDEDNTVPSDLTGVAVTIEIDDPVTLATVIWTPTVSGNTATFDQNATTSQFSWNAAKFRVVLTRTAIREVIMTGEVRVQR